MTVKEGVDEIYEIFRREHLTASQAVAGDTVEELGEYKTPVEANWALEHIMSRIVSQKPLIEMPRYTEPIGNSEDRINE